MAENIKTRSGNRFYDFFIISVLFILSMLIRVYNYAEQSVQSDEIIYSSYAYSILSHNWAWPPEFMGANPPLLPYILAIATYLFEGGLDVFRIISIFFGSLSVCVIYFLGKSLYNRRVGILAAILLCFCSQHILHSRTVMLEAIWIFLFYTSMYYFWRSYNDENDIKYALLSGVFLGLALDTKYNALLLYPSIALFILWSNKRGWVLGWKHLIKRKYLLLFFVSILIFLPVLIVQSIKGVDPFYFNLFGRTGQESWAGYRTAAGFDILDMFKRGFNNYIDMVVDGHNATTLSLPWLPAFYIAASLLLIITLLYFLYLLFKSQNNANFLMITFIILYAFIALFGINYQHYLLWGFPLFFIMLSYLIVLFIEKIGFQIKNHVFSLLDWMKIFTLILACIFIFSCIVVGIIAPSVNTWNLGGYEEQVIHIKNKINPGDCIFTSQFSNIIYYLDKYDFNAEENNIHVFWLYKTHVSSWLREGRINLRLIKLIEPRFLIISDQNFYMGASVQEQIVIREKYQKISTVNGVSLYERKD